MGKTTETVSFDKLTVELQWTKPGRREVYKFNNPIVEIEYKESRIMDHKDMLQKPEDEDKENTNKEPLYLCWKVPAGGKNTKNTE